MSPYSCQTCSKWSQKLLSPPPALPNSLLWLCDKDQYLMQDKAGPPPNWAFKACWAALYHGVKGCGCHEGSSSCQKAVPSIFAPEEPFPWAPVAMGCLLWAEDHVEHTDPSCVIYTGSKRGWHTWRVLNCNISTYRAFQSRQLLMLRNIVFLKCRDRSKYGQNLLSKQHPNTFSDSPACGLYRFESV